MPDAPASSRVAWLAPLAVLACVTFELAIAWAPLGVRARTAALLMLAALAVGLALRHALGGLASRGLRRAVVGAVIFSVVLTVVVALDAYARGGAVLR